MKFAGPTWLLHSAVLVGTAATVASLVLLYLEVTDRLNWMEPESVVWLDTSLCIVMLAEWFVLWWAAESRWKFIRARWIDLLASMPLLLFFRPFRVIRLLRLLRLLRGIALMHKIMRPWEKAIDTTLLKSATIAAVILILICSTLVMDLERSNPNLDSFQEALWWSVVTATTVGYGDRFPITPGGQFVAVLLMILGIGLIGTLAASLTAALTPRKPQVTTEDLMERMNVLEDRLTQLLENRETNHS